MVRFVLLEKPDEANIAKLQALALKNLDYYVETDRDKFFKRLQDFSDDQIVAIVHTSHFSLTAEAFTHEHPDVLLVLVSNDYHEVKREGSWKEVPKELCEKPRNFRALIEVFVGHKWPGSTLAAA